MQNFIDIRSFLLLSDVYGTHRYSYQQTDIFYKTFLGLGGWILNKFATIVFDNYNTFPDVMDVGEVKIIW